MKSYLEIRFLRSNMIYTLILAAALMYGCATPVGVNLLTPQEANRELTESVLSNDSLSAPTQQLLNQAGLSDQFKKDPTGAIEALRIGVPMASQSEKCFALAELSFLHASQGLGTKTTTCPLLFMPIPSFSL